MYMADGLVRFQKGVNAAGKQFGKDLSPEETEKYSDQAREVRCISISHSTFLFLTSHGVSQGYKKATGKDIPIEDKDAAAGSGGGASEQK